MIEVIVETAREAGKKILGYYNEEIEVTSKEDESPLTKADMAAHYYIVGKLEELDPNTPVISEESGVPDYEVRKNWNRFWIVDPLDGTKEFIKKNGEFTVNIALIEDGEPVLGVVYAPAMDLVYYGTKNSGSFKQIGNDKAERIYSIAADRSKPLKIIESRSHGSSELEEYLQKESIIVEGRVKSGSSLKICLVADGTADLYPRLAPTMEWDVAAGDAVFRYSAKAGNHESGIKYNKENLLNSSFVIGF
ncbi:3'(2'),5'-bisphosphate nucleotidase CysQ [Gelidibacter japonicus]|uniref:3'(2'),5'-bisphosphate nucleotidase CysQ n=1 Tax=Gelidibacter japonicus TaxID=1962232 RepID=UPI003A946192